MFGLPFVRLLRQPDDIPLVFVGQIVCFISRMVSGLMHATVADNNKLQLAATTNL